MRREQLTNVTTEARCNLFSSCAFNESIYSRNRGRQIGYTEQFNSESLVRDLADRIIALRSQQVAA